MKTPAHTLMLRAKCNAKKMAERKELREEFAQDICVKFLSQGPGQTLGQMRVDILREVHGREGEKDELNSIRESGQVSTRDVETDPLLRKMISKALDQLKPSDRAMLTLNVFYDYSKEEIGFIFGCTGSNVVLKLGQVKRFMKKIIQADRERE